jgi:PAS domain S-box-containing protein
MARFFVFKILSLSLFLFLYLNVPILNAKDTINVVIDNNYPPYSFINEKGDLTGYSIDLWRKFEEKTGIKVVITAKEWNKAQEEMKAGKYDVIDTLFKNPEREKIYIFSDSYEDVDTHIFYHKNITGISEIENLKGFQIATKKGGATVQFLKNKGFTNIKEYNSDEEMILSAKKGEIVAFAIGKNTGYFFLYKYGLQNEFKIYLKPLFTNQLHRAALRNNYSIIEVVNNGMRKIDQKDLKEIREKWFGVYQLKQYNYKILVYAIAILIFGIFLLFLLTFLLNRIVKKRTEELEMEKVKFSSIFDNADHMIALLDKNGFIMEANKLTLETMKLNKDQIKKMHISELPLFAQRYELSEKTKEGVEYIKSNLVTANFNTSLKNLDGVEKYLSLSLTPIIIKGDLKYIIAEGKDITEFIQMTKEIENYKATKNLEMLVSGLSHDFNNLLTGISNYLLIMKEINKDTEINTILEKTINAYKRAAKMVKQLLSFSKGLQIIYQDVDIADLIKQSLHLNISGKSIKIEFIDNLNKNIKCDPNLISEAIDNLIINAYQALEKNGKIEISLESYIDDKEYALIKIQDNGCGIPKDRLETIFQPLYTTKSKGSGLGLYMVKLIVEKHGGYIKVESEENRGSIFYIYLPVDNN